MIGAIGFSASASAGEASGGVITSFTTNTDAGWLYVTTNGTRTGAPSCTTAPSYWALPLTTAYSPVYAQLLTAFTTQTPISLWGDGICANGYEVIAQTQSTPQ